MTTAGEAQLGVGTVPGNPTTGKVSLHSLTGADIQIKNDAGAVQRIVTENFSPGVNLGTATGAASGELKASAALYGFGLESAMYLIATQTLASDGQFLFSSIPQTFRHLVILGNVRSTKVATRDALYFRVAPVAGAIDTGANYSFQGLQIVNVTITANPTTNSTGLMAGQIDAASSTAGAFSAVNFTIPNYRSTLFWKSATFVPSMAVGDNTAANLALLMDGTVWRNTAAIEQIQSALSNNLLAGSTLSLYGVRG